MQMLMPKKNRIAIYELLFKEGVMVAKKDVHLAKHPELADKNVPNLHVMKAMQVRKNEGPACKVLTKTRINWDVVTVNGLVGRRKRGNVTKWSWMCFEHHLEVLGLCF